MAYVALYRKWRPQDFGSLVGQDHISLTLKNAIASGKIAHAYLFAGPRGTGKTTTAKILAKSLNCQQGPTPTPCNVCPNCEKITGGTSMDVFEVDAASNRGIDEIRDLRETVKFSPVDGRYKVYIIDEVHMLTTEAFNALLKTLEEPPGHVVFVLATTEPHKIPATIHSRCQRYDFRRIGVREIEQRLALVANHSDLEVVPEALKLIAIQADGGMRDALSILDQCAALDSGGVITAAHVRQLLGLIGHEWVWQLTDAIADRDTHSLLLKLDEVINLGKDVRQLLVEMALHARSLMLFKAAPAIENIEMYSEDKSVLAAQSAKFSHQELVEMLELLHSTMNETKWASEPRIAVEMALITLCRRAVTTDIAALIERIAVLESRFASKTVIKEESTASINLQPIQPLPEPPKPSPASPELPPQTPKAPRQAGGQSAGTETVTSPPSAAPAGSTGNLNEIWAAVLKELLTGGKRSVHACVMQGHLISHADDQATVRFSATFPKERTEKDDYRAIVEKAFAQVTGQQVRIVCVLGQDTPVARPTASPPVTSVQPDPGINHPAVKQAQMMFGGTIVKIEEEKKI